MQTYNHPFIEYGQMSAALISKGMSGNSSVIELRLEDVGYQRLSAYWKPFLDYKGNRGWSKQPQFAKNQWEWYAAYDETFRQMDSGLNKKQAFFFAVKNRCHINHLLFTT